MKVELYMYHDDMITFNKFEYLLLIIFIKNDHLNVCSYMCILLMSKDSCYLVLGVYVMYGVRQCKLHGF